MRKAFRLLTASFATLLFLAVGQFNHVAAMQMPHDMAGMNHNSSTSSSQTCATLCSTMTVGKEEKYYTVERRDEDEPEPPFYLALRSQTYLATLPVRQPDDPELPLKVPIHIRIGVFRS